MLLPKPDTISAPSATGTLAKRPLAHLLIYALDRKLTGTFEIGDANGSSVHIVVTSGLVSRVATSEPVTYLGHVLYEMGAIDDAVLSTSLAEVAAGKRLHGQVLLARGAIDAGQLAEGLRQQRGRKLSHAFGMPADATFAFYGDADFIGPRPNDVEPVSPLPDVWRGVLAYPQWDHVRATLARVGGRPLRLLPEARTVELGFDEHERNAAECLRMKPQTVPELAIVGGLASQATELLAYFLVITKQAQIAESVAASRPPAAVSGSMRATTPAMSFEKTLPSGEYVRKISFQMRAITPDADPIRIPSPLPERIPSPYPSRSQSPLPPRTTPYPTGLRISAPPAPGQIVSSAPPPADLARRKSILDRAKWIDQEDYYKMLMVPREATTQEIRAAFLRAAKVWHPDSLPLSIIDVRSECERVFSRITTAYETLVEPAKRARYEKEIDASQREDAEAAHLVAQAEMHVTLGERAEAETLARKAVVASPKMAEARALLAYLESLDPKRGKEDHLRSCVRTLDVAIGSDPQCAHAHYYRAMLQKRLEEHEGAIRDLRVAVTNDPDDAEALRELKIYETKLRDGTIQLRSASPTGTKKPEGFFDRLRTK
jgi:hypothetical protein